MKTELLFKDKKFVEDFPGIPREGDFVRHESFPKDLRVKRVLWTREGTLLELEDPTKGHKWVSDDSGTSWLCQRCEAAFCSDVPPSHPNFPGSATVKGWVDECDVELARQVHGA